MTTTPSRALVAAATLAALAVLPLAGCASPAAAGSRPATSTTTTTAAAAPTGYTVISQPSLRPGDPVPAPTEKVVLTFSGKTTRGGSVRLDLPTIERLGLVEYSVDDKQAEGHRVTFRGVLLRSLLDYVGVEEGATLHTLALNDYAVDVPASDASAYPVMLATSVDGRRMTVEHYGPTRIVYPTDSFDLDPVTYDPRWTWQLKEIVVK
ncbi:molybdopterin-dependent oxidoreductase [Arthrobacter sp. NEB 688]|uniref:molybdopterin-dependent oxidoreductase n=1 Tax=Arthrobacter sp. NEB 688 TaxID=904039 RepID=UPI001564CF6B|nr:molybdopterin-dependent oxidoreductase [Arthrobacter sp. NEB 688]QKE84804.1 molybdopterin-dependent oxidoreductase [Arthrobacter sp. NEB 688]